MNLVTAVIVHVSIDQALDDREVQEKHRQAEIQAMLPKLKDMFDELDKDESGTVTLDELLDQGDFEVGDEVLVSRDEKEVKAALERVGQPWDEQMSGMLGKRFHVVDATIRDSIGLQSPDDNKIMYFPSKVLTKDDPLCEELMKYMQADSLKEVFEIIDDDGSGEVTTDEFIEALTKILCSESPVEFIPIRKKLGSCRFHVHEMKNVLRELHADQVDEMREHDVE